MTKLGSNCKLHHQNKDGTDVFHMVAEMPAPLSAREYLLRRVVKVQGDVAFILSRTVRGKAARELRSHPLRTRAHLHIGGYLFKRLSPTKTRVTYIVGSDLGGVFAIDWIARKAAPYQVKKIVNWLREVSGVHVGFEHACSGVDEVEEGFASVNPMRAAKNAATEEIEMGDITASNEKRNGIEQVEEN